MERAAVLLNTQRERGRFWFVKDEGGHELLHCHSFHALFDLQRVSKAEESKQKQDPLSESAVQPVVCSCSGRPWHLGSHISHNFARVLFSFLAEGKLPPPTAPTPPSSRCQWKQCFSHEHLASWFKALTSSSRISGHKLLLLIESCRFWLMRRTSLTTDLLLAAVRPTKGKQKASVLET